MVIVPEWTAGGESARRTSSVFIEAECSWCEEDVTMGRIIWDIGILYWDFALSREGLGTTFRAEEGRDNGWSIELEGGRTTWSENESTEFDLFNNLGVESARKAERGIWGEIVLGVDKGESG